MFNSRMERRPRGHARTIAAGIVAALVTALIPGTVAVGAAMSDGDMTAGAAASDGDMATGNTASAADGSATPGTTTITLLTGDQVSLGTADDGTRSVTINPAPRASDVTFTRAAVGDALYVIPSDVAPLVPDVLDRDLFDVARLADSGYDDAGRGTTPVIIQAAGGPDGDRPLDLVPFGIEPERTLSSVGAVSAELTPDTAGTLLDSLLAGDPSVGRVWLDAPVRKLDVDSASQVGAPAAWDSGWSGEGVTVAVLDTGIDATHPDVDDVVIGSQDFTGKGEVTDGSGHGTHVASIIAGDGDASGGSHRGIAPGADLLVGKVLDDTGHGEQSWIIDGMEWAAAQGADVVNLSLGSDATDGTDPVSAAVDELSATHDTLFVAAAGNARDHETVASPGSATSALTVGAVDDDDVVGAFSSKGPRVGDGAIKPDVTAPGVEVLAARATGTSPGLPADDLYLPGTGTSMAAPHVAGAAAVLRGAHPEWSAARLKAQLVGSAEPSRDSTVWAQGAGRIWIPDALELPVTAEPVSVSFGALEYPSEDPGARTITYRNPTDQDLDLSLTSELTGPDGSRVKDGLTLDAQRLTVPAGGTAEVDLNLDTSVGPLGRYSGAVTASVKGGGNRTLRTAVGYEKKPEIFDVTLRPVGRDGDPLSGRASLSVLDVRNLKDHQELLTFSGEKTIQVTAGRYGIVGGLYETAGDGTVEAITGVNVAEFAVDRDMVVEVSAVGAMPVSVETPRPADLVRASLDYQRWDASDNALDIVVSGDAPLYATPSEPVTTGYFDMVANFVLTEPTSDGAEPDYSYDLAFQQSPVSDVSFEADPDDLAQVAAGYAQGPRDVVPTAGWGALAPGHFVSWSTLDPVAPSAARTEYLTGGSMRWTKSVWYTQLIDGGAGGIVNHGSYDAPSRQFPAGSATETVYGGGAQSITASVSTSREQLEVAATGWTDSAGHEFQVPQWASGGFDQRLRLWQEDELVTDVEQGHAVVPTPKGKRQLRLAYDAERRSPWPTAPQVSGEWVFAAHPPSGDRTTPLPLLQIGYDIAGIDLGQAAPAGTTVTLTARVPEGGKDAAATSATVWWSGDDGTTWNLTEVTEQGEGVFTAPVDAPPGTRQVSLRVEAANAEGSVRETTLGAYLVEP